MDIANIGLNVTICGIVIVFGMLVLLVLVFTLFGKVMSSGGKKSEKKSKQATPETEISNQVKPSVAIPSQDDEEIIAVISAAVASMYAGSGKKAFVRSIRRSGERSAWAAAGVARNTSAF